MRKLLVIGFVLLSGLSSLAQNDYYMSNAKVYDCKGNFFDSDNGLITGDYDHNEDYIFTICVQGDATITLTFRTFCTESVEDYLIIYDGCDTSASKLSNRISGSNNPGSFTSTDSCLTIYFHSDVSVPCDGWEAYWTTKVEPILPPRFVIPPAASCEDNVLGFKFDQKWNCDSISAGNFTVSGPINPTVTGITPVNCDGNNETDTFTISVSPILDRSGQYTLEFDGVKYDACDSAWQLHSDTTFSITDCPIYVNLIADPDTVCLGTCTEITAEVTGGDSTKYMFNWSASPTISGTFGPHTFCPTTSGWVKLTVSDGLAVPGSDSIWIEVVNPPVARGDTTVCEAGTPFNLSATPTGGYWKGNGIADSSSALFDPALARAGVHPVVYWFAGCTDTVNVTVIAFDAGGPNASCPGAPPFIVTGFNPTGGTWSGPNITSNGEFNPSDTGVYTVTYSWNGCTDTKIINVYDVFAQEFDTVCQSQDSLRLNFTPIGGFWSGPGLIDPQSGWFYPPRAGGGNKRLIYNANGCRDTTYIYVKPINARGNQISCPDAAPFDVYAGLPSGGYWTGLGITDSIQGTYDGSFVYGLGRTWYNDTVRYHINGCVDHKIVYVRKTVVAYDTVKFCIEDPRIQLTYATTRRSPGGGVWSGNGVTGSYFTPVLAGRGAHKLYYDAYGCRDSIVMYVHPQSIIQNDTLLCETDNPLNLYMGQSGGSWAGNGVTDANGVFDPNVAGVGVHRLYYTSKNGCLDSCEIEVEPRPVVKISGFDPIYCFKDSNFLIVATPPGGVFTGTTFGDSLFNPNLSGKGNHKLRYRFGTATCYSDDSVIVQVLDTLKGSFTYDDDSLCFGEQTTLVAGGSRGSGNSFTYTWSNSSSSDRTLYTRPPSSRWVYVTVSDGCSDSYRDSVYIHVFPRITATAATSDTQCLGTVGFAELFPQLSNPYALTWHTTPEQYTNRIDVLVGKKYDFRLQDTYTKCILDSGIYVPSYPRINAHFITSPAEGICLNPFDPEVQIIDYSVGAPKGTWYFGDGWSEPYVAGTNPSHLYNVDTNEYEIWLFVENRGGCKDSFSLKICVDDSVYVLVPTAFSPGVDGINDVYRLRTAGVTEFEMAIFNRWGERVFDTTDKDFEWDGVYMGKRIPMGIYPFYIKYKGKKTVRKLIKGTIQVIR